MAVIDIIPNRSAAQIDITSGSGDFTQWGDILGDLNEQTDLQGALNKSTQALTNVRLLIEDKLLYIIAPKGLIKETDTVVFARYTTSKIRYTSSHSTVYRRQRHGWVEPKWCSSTGGAFSKTFGPLVQFVLTDITTDRPGIGEDYEQFLVSFAEDSPIGAYEYKDSAGVTQTEDRIAYVFDKAHNHNPEQDGLLAGYVPRLYLNNKRLGIRITRDGKPLTEWLEFTVRKTTVGNPGLSRVWM